MSSSIKNRIVSSTVGAILLTGVVLAGVYCLGSSENFTSNAALAWLFIVPLAVIFWEKNAFVKRNPFSWIDWLGAFIVGLALSAIFLEMDCGWPNPFAAGKFSCVKFDPGPSVVFTISSIFITTISLPGAVRAWLLARIEVRGNADMPHD